RKTAGRRPSLPTDPTTRRSPVRTRTRLAVFALGLLGALGVGYAAGAAVGPIGGSDPARPPAHGTAPHADTGGDR
ncbi:MAG: hypothetical protein ACKOVH_03785, partial [Actinomycetota bacterium]